MMMGVKRYTSGGALDTGFGIAGIASADFNAKSVQFGRLAIDPFGNILGIMYNPHYVEVLGSQTA